MLFFKNNKNSLPQQVSENMKRIEVLEAYIKQSYYTRYEYGDDILPTPWAVDLASTDIPQDTPIGAFNGFLLSKDSKLFSIINIQYEYDQQGVPYKIVNANYVCNLKGPKGERGTDGVDGQDGQNATSLSMGTVTSGTTADASLTPVGDGNYELNLTLPRGETGATGSVGPTGPTGPQGPAGQNGVDGTQIYSTTVLDFTPPQAGSTFTVPIASTNIPSDTPIGSLDALLINGSASLYNNLEVLLIDNIKNVKGYFVTNEKGPKGDTGDTGLGYRYENVNFGGEQWVADSTTLPGYNYKIFGYIPDITANTFVDIKFSYEDIMKFVYAPVCISTTDGVYIFSTTNTETPSSVGALIYEEG